VEAGPCGFSARFCGRIRKRGYRTENLNNSSSRISCTRSSILADVDPASQSTCRARSPGTPHNEHFKMRSNWPSGGASRKGKRAKRGKSIASIKRRAQARLAPTFRHRRISSPTTTTIAVATASVKEVNRDRVSAILASGWPVSAISLSRCPEVKRISWPGFGSPAALPTLGC